MGTPAAVDRVVVGIPVLTFADARVSETQTCPIVLPCQFKGDRGGTSLKGFPAIAEAMGRLKHKDLANFNHARPPLEPDRSSRAQIDFSFYEKPAFQFCFLSQRLEDTLWSGIDKQIFL